MGVFGQVPRVVEDAGVFCVVVLWLLRDADSLCEEARVVGKVEGAGKKPALLKDVGDIAEWTGVARVDVGELW